MNIDKLVENIRGTVERHRIEPGGYRRWLWNNASGGRQLGVNEYGCADAANILYTIGCFEGDPAARENWVRTMQGMQDPETGLFHEATHHPFHTTAHVTAALELFDARPLYPVKAMLPYLPKEIWEPLFFTVDQNDEMAPILTDLSACVTEYRAAFIGGTKDIDAEWDNYVNEINKMRVDRYLEIVQESLDSHDADK